MKLSENHHQQKNRILINQRSSGMKKLICLLIIVTFFISCQDNQAKEELLNYRQIDELIQNYHDNGQFDGTVLVAKSGIIIFKKGYGLANREWDIPNEPNTKFRIGSITKQFTAMAIMILQEQGKIHVQDLISKFVPDCPEACKDITIHHLLTHKSGIPNFEYFPDNLQFERLPTTVEKTVERFKNKELMFSPGAKFGYSSSGYVLLGFIIERVTGESYENVLSEYIFEPLEMKNSGYDHPTTILKHRAAGYTSGSLPQNAIHFEMDTPHAAGALYSTVEDLFLWDQSLYTNRLVTYKTLETIFPPMSIGYGWFLGEYLNRKFAQHSGSINGFRAQTTRFPDEKVFIISLSNRQSIDPYEINQSIADVLFNEQ